MTKGTHDYQNDPRNAAIKISINGELFPRDEAKVSVFDSGYVLGDGVWEGLRLHDGGLPFLDQHLDRLYEGARAIDMDIGLTREQLTQRLLDTLRANSMRDGVHIRLMVTRGVKATPHQDPRFVIGGATVVIIPEYKLPLPATVEQGIRLFTVHVRRGAPDVQDPKLNSHSKLNCILACIQAQKAGYDEALMLDPHGFVGHLQFHAFLHRAQGRGVDVHRQILPRRHHPRQRDSSVPRQRHSRVRERLQPHRRVRRRRSLRHRHLRRAGAGHARSTAA